ncbi:MAG: DUF188 domain-containing protein [Spirochaetales bacterium]|nr:DUF188 domain-containing protein [Spirochaetales bacterium]
MAERPSIWVDADSCPRKIRDIILRASRRTGLSVVFVSNRLIPLDSPDDRLIHITDAGEGSADEFILSRCFSGDIVITRDIPLAARLLEKGCRVLNDRGDVFQSESIRERLSLRDRMKDLREAGLLEEGKRSFGLKEVHRFAAALDRELASLSGTS